MKMSEVENGKMVFNEQRMDDEIRETYYTKDSETSYRHHGCIQGLQELEDGERPRYVNFVAEGFVYPLVPALPVKPISESKFIGFVKV